MTTVEQKSKLPIQIRLNAFSLFVLASVLIHGLGLLLLIGSQRSPITKRQEVESTPIDFVIVPPEESPAEPPPDTERRAVNNSVAKGNIEPESPSAANELNSEQEVAPSEPNPVTPPEIPTAPSTAVAPQTPTPPQVEPAPQSKPQQVEQSQPVTPPPSLPKAPKIANTSPAEEVKPTTPLPAKPEPIEQSQPLVEQSPPSPQKEPKPAPPVISKPQSTEKTPLLSESNSDSIPSPQPAPKPEETPSNETETATPQPKIPPVATNSSNLPTQQKPIETDSSPTETPSIPENTSVPETTPNPSSEQKTPVGSGSASLLTGTNSRSLSQDSEDFFFNSSENASQQALNPSGVDAQQDLDLGPYFAEVRRRVRRNWQPSSPGDNRQTILAFSIQRNGQITGLQIRQSSGSPKVDRESLEAVQKAGPFAALPANFPNEQLDVEFNFNIYVNQGSFTPDLESWQRF
ncbi:TonB family protein [Hyella patelloides LEGE 07179]|uniref:TonB family protein n=1 Tax=Hyella patelloides LEGE 07179 TaxID=945734 RepID=A0A563W3F3_9CYAN|nr:energy transducer TonB [Hyella patelloides]VEP18185.1 TonB family protein [Hyella patelloides LEGE 07179]